MRGPWSIFDRSNGIGDNRLIAWNWASRGRGHRLIRSAADGQWGIEVAGGAAPSIVQAKLANLEVFRSDEDIRQLAPDMTQLRKRMAGIDARAEIAYEGNVVFHVRGSLERKRCGAFSREEGGVTGSAPGGFSSSVVFTVDPSVAWTDVNCLAPGCYTAIRPMMATARPAAS